MAFCAARGLGLGHSGPLLPWVGAGAACRSCEPVLLASRMPASRARQSLRSSPWQPAPPHTKARPRAKADPADPLQIGAPIPGMISTLVVSVGTKAAKNAKLLTLEAMKMQTTVYAPADGIVDKVLVQVGEAVQSKDLLLHLRAK